MADSNFGTSSSYTILLQNMQTKKYHRVSKFDLSKTHPPQIEINKSNVSVAVQKWITPWPVISFEKINFPKYEGLNQYIGEASNKPDYIKDYHLIALARNIDYWSKPEYQGIIVAETDSPQAASK